MSSPTPLRLLTWNVWFHTLAQTRRMEAIAEAIARHRPHVIGLQELTEAGLVALLGPDSPLREYQPVPSDVAALQGYWEGLYTRLPIGPRSGRFAYEWSMMGRGLTVLHCPSLDLVVGVTHLESLEHASYRAAQASEALERLDDFGTANAVFMGDMNLYGEESLEPRPDGWVDAWESLHPHDEGWTRDYQRNPMLAHRQQERLDRIVVRSSDYRLQDIQLLGTAPLAPSPAPPPTTPSPTAVAQSLRQAAVSPETSPEEPSPPPLYPSDHFGLLLSLQPR